MFGYEFIGWDALNELTKNVPLAVWIGDHILLLNIILGIAALVAKMTPTTKDDEFWAALKEKLGAFEKK